MSERVSNKGVVVNLAPPSPSNGSPGAITRISIITPSFNHCEFIEDTIRSVLSQDYGDIEHIVIDGGSTDGTIDVLRRYPHLKWVSEPDRGQSDAINKGFRMATGEILAWLNSDDYYAPGAIHSVVRYFDAHPDCMILYGDIAYVTRNKDILYSIQGDTVSYDALIQSPDIIRQPSTFWRRCVLDEVGLLDESLHLVMDFDFLVRVGRQYRYHYLPKVLSNFRWYEQSKTASMMRRQAVELFLVYRKRRIRLGFHGFKFLLGRFLDSLRRRNPLRIALGVFRKKAPPA